MTRRDDSAGSGPVGASGLARRLWPFLLVVAVVAAFWGGVWRQTADSALTRVPLLDEAWYLRDAARLRAEGLPGREPFVMSPGYSLLVALAGPGPLDDQGRLVRHPRALLAGQALAWLAGGLLVGAVVYGAGRRAGASQRACRTAACVAVLLLLLYRPGAIYARTILLEVWLTLFVTAAVAAVAAAPRPGPGRVAVAGLALGLAALLRAHALVLLPLLAVAAWTGRPRPGRAAAVALLAAASLLPPMLAAWHNSQAAGRPAGPSLNAGLNLYLGQVPDGQGLFTSLAGLDQEWQPSGEAYLSARLGRPVVGPAAADAVWRREAWRLIADDPGRAASGWLRKVWLHLQAWEIAQVTPLSAWTGEAPLLRALVVPWSLLVVLGLAGAAAAAVLPGALRRTALPWLAAAALLVAAQSLFFVVSRYRLPLAPILAVLAGCGLLALPMHWRASRPRLVWPALALLLAAVATVPWGLGDARRQWAGLEELNHARRLVVLAAAAGEDPARGDLHERAERLLARAVETAGRRHDVWALRASNLAAAGDPKRAVAVLSRGIMQADHPAPLQRQQLAVLRDLGRLDDVEALLHAYLRDRPADGDLWHDLVVLLGRQGRWQEAAARARAFQAAVPEDHRGWLDLGVALAQLGRREAAAQAFADGLERFPDGVARAQLAANLALLGEAALER